MKITMRTAIGIGAAGLGTGLHLLTVGHPVLAAALGGAAVAWPAVRDWQPVVQGRRRPAADGAPVETEAPAAVTA